jgi:hypothetical protein
MRRLFPASSEPKVWSVARPTRSYEGVCFDRRLDKSTIYPSRPRVKAFVSASYANVESVAQSVPSSSFVMKPLTSYS